MVENVTKWPRKRPQGVGAGGGCAPPARSTEALAKYALENAKKCLSNELYKE